MARAIKTAATLQATPRPVAPPRVLRTLRRGLSPDPQDRFDSMLPLLAALSMG